MLFYFGYADDYPKQIDDGETGIETIDPIEGNYGGYDDTKPLVPGHVLCDMTHVWKY